MKKLLLVALLTIFIGGNSYSQSLSIIDTTSALSVPDSVSYGSNSGYTIDVQYFGPSPFTGTIYLVAGVDSSAGVQSIDTVGSQAVVGFLNLDTANIFIPDTFDNNNGYRFGGNVVVIWPVAATLTTLDTFQTNVFVTQALGVTENQDLYNAFSVYPNPLKNYIHIDKYDQNIDIKHVRIYNLKGQLIYDEKFKSKINISHLPRGMYFLKLELKREEELNYKLIKH